MPINIAGVLTYWVFQMEIFPVMSLLAQALVIVIAAAIALKKKKTYGWLFAASFALFLVYDIWGLLGTAINESVKGFMLLAGVVLSLVAVWQLYQEK